MKNVTVHVLLWYSDGYAESLGFDLPTEIDSFIEFINTFSKEKNYKIELAKVE